MTAQRLRLILIITFAALVLGVASTVALAVAVGPRISPRSPALVMPHHSSRVRRPH
jgi:hypothetical protein